MLVVLSEINCLNKLNQMGIYPDIFYTDFNMFKNQVVSHKNVTAIIILAGTCNFNKRHTIEFAKILRKYRRDENMSIRHVYIVSDSEISNLDNYFKFTGDISDLTIMSGYKVLGKDDKLWKKYKSEPKKSQVIQSDFYSNNVDKAVEEYKNRDNTEDDYVELIQIPNIKKMLGIE